MEKIEVEKKLLKLTEELKSGIVEEQTKIDQDHIRLLSDIAEDDEKNNVGKRYGIGFYPFDDTARLTRKNDGGLCAGEVLTIGGVTGNGKTLLASTISYNLLKNHGVPSLWLTYEVTPWMLWQIFKQMGLSKKDVICAPAKHTTGKLDWVEAKIKEAKEKYMCYNVVIDHLGFLAPKQDMNQQMSQNYSAYLTQIVRELKTIALKEGVSIILPVHMVKSTGNEPTLRDIGNSGGIAQESDFVLLISREIDDSGKNTYTQYSKVILAKNRVGGDTPSWWVERINGRLHETNHIKNINQKYEIFNR